MPRNWKKRIPIPAFLKSLNSLQFLRHGRVHTKHVFNIFELERKATQQMLYKREGKYARLVPMSPEEISRWYTRITQWSETYPLGKGSEYTPTKVPRTVYEFREGKFRPLRSNLYYFDIRKRAAERGQKNVMALESIIAEKERLVASLEKKKPRSAKKTTRRYALVNHNQKLHELYSTIASAARMQLLKMDQLKQFIENAPMGEEARKAQLQSIGNIIRAFEVRKEIAEREAYLAGNRILLLKEFKGIAAYDKRVIQNLARELISKGKARDLVEEKWLESRRSIGGGDANIEFARAQAQIQYWMAFNTLVTAYMTAYHTYGTTLSKIEIDDIENGIRDSRERIDYFKRYAAQFRPKPG